MNYEKFIKKAFSQSDTIEIFCKYINDYLKNLLDELCEMYSYNNAIKTMLEISNNIKNLLGTKFLKELSFLEYCSNNKYLNCKDDGYFYVK